MKIHLVGGFLGSGKTTAITSACRILAEKGIVSSVITNDQGRYLVDSSFVKQEGIPVAEVTGGCFCCNYNQLDSQISSLINEKNPSEIFAEFVGSCTDLVATVLKPLLEYKKDELEQVTFSSFVDAQLLFKHLNGEELSFSLETNYIWEKQLEESENLIINKIDLLSNEQTEKLKFLLKDQFPSKKVLFQNSLKNKSVENWIEIIKNIEEREHKSLDIDYVKYGKGEANLAWLDEEIEIISSNESSVSAAYSFIQTLSEEISKSEFPIGHLKFYLTYNTNSEKISYTTILNDALTKKPVEKAKSLDMLINARIQTTPENLKNLLMDCLEKLRMTKGIRVNEKFLSYFQPGVPKPTHRMA